MTGSPEEIGAKMNALGLWDLLMPYNFAVKPKGTVFPYFCTVLKDDHAAVRARFLMLEGWQTLHDFVRTRFDRNFGFYLTPAEMPHFELIVLATGETRLFRHDPGYVPQEANAAQKAFAARILWESYGVMLRVEADRTLPLRFVDEKAIFARVETAPGTWTDAPLEIPDPPPYAERVTFPKEVVKAAQDLPFAKDEALELDFRLLTGVATREPRPRCVYALRAVDAKTGEVAIDCRASMNPETGLRGLWEAMPGAVLREIVRRGRVPGEIRLSSGRVFRLLRTLCLELPFRISLHDSLDKLT